MKNLFFCLVLALLLGSGCATKPGAIWDASIGNASYDDIVKKLGPPEKETTLSDGTRVGDWFMRRGATVTTFQSFPNSFLTTGQVHEFPDSMIRFTFDQDGVLQSWKRVYR